MGPVKLQFAGHRPDQGARRRAKRIVVDAAGADEKGRGQAAMLVTAQLAPAAAGTRVEVDQDLQLSGAAAQYGRGMISDVTAILMRDFADNMQTRIDAIDRGDLAGPGRRGDAGQRLRHRRCGRRGWRWAACCAASSCPTNPTRAEEDAS